MKYLALYLFIINFIAVVLCLVDKSRAKNKKWRVSEKALFAVSFMGGSISMYITMCLVRHKTNHKRFMIGLPLIILIQSAVLLWILHTAS